LRSYTFFVKAIDNDRVPVNSRDFALRDGQALDVDFTTSKARSNALQKSSFVFAENGDGKIF